MRSRTSYTLFTSSRGWRIGIGAEGKTRLRAVQVDTADPLEIAGELADALRAAGHQGSPIVLALPSEWCMCASIPTHGLPRRGKREAMLYRFEEQLPLTAEDLAVDFVVHNGTALAIGMQTRTLEQVLEALGAQGIDIAAVCPAALLALQGARRLPETAGMFKADAVLWQDEGRVELFRLADGEPVGWLSIPARADDVALALATQVLQRRSALTVGAIGMSDAMLAGIERTPDVAIVARADVSASEAALVASTQVLKGREAAPADLRDANRPAGYAPQWLRRSLTAAAIALAVLCVALPGAALLRASRYAGLARQAEDRKVALFRKLFPNEPVPVGIESRLRSAERKARGAASSLNVPQAVDALESLRGILANLPPDLRFRVTDLDVEASRLTVGGEVPTHGDADALAAALRGSGRFTIDDPQTQQLPGDTVQFSITGTIRPAADGAAKP